MSQWGQFPLQTGFHQQQPQFQQHPQFPQQPQFQQQSPLAGPQLQQGFNLGPSQLVAQPTGFPQRPQGLQQPQQTGFQPSSGFLQSQPTGFPGGAFQQQARPAPPPVPPLPTQLQQPNQSLSFLNAPPSQQSRFLAPSPSVIGGIAPQPTGFGARTAAPLVSQPTGFVDPRLQLMSSTFMPMNTSAPYSAAGAPLLAPQQQNLYQSFQQYQGQRGSSTQPTSWALSKAEKKNYDQIFRSWDAQSTGFINGQTALEVFGASGLQKEELARIWSLADKDNQGKLNIAEFHVAMGLIFRRLSGLPIPEQLPPELVPPSARDLDTSVDMLKDLLKNETRSRSPAGLDAPVSRLKNRSFNSTSPSFESSRDATIYKHDDAEPPGGFYQPRSRHINRDNVRSRNEQGAAADLSEMKRKLANTAEMLDRTAAAEAAKTVEDEELEQEMEDLRRQVEQVSEDLEYVSRGSRTAAKDGEKRQLERHLMSLMHERIPDLESKIKARDEKREREKRQWVRDRDRANERFGKYDAKDDGYSSRKYDDRDSPYSRGVYDRGDRDNAYDKDDGRRDYNRSTYRRDTSRPREQERERERERIRTPPRSARSPPPAPSASTLSARETPPPKSSPSPGPLKNMTAEERQAYAKAEARRRIEARMAALGVTSPSTTVDTSVEERLQQEKKEAEEKARTAEKQAEERERLRRERLENEKALKESKFPSLSVSPTKANTAELAPAPTPTPKAAPAPKAAPRPPKPKAPAPPPPRRVPTVQITPSAPQTTTKQPIVRTPVVEPPAVPQIDPEEEALRLREEALKKQREARAERLRQLEKEEEEAARREEERYQARIQTLTARATAQPTQHNSQANSSEPSSAVSPSSAPPAPTRQTSSPIPQTAPQTAVTSSTEKSTNPFSRFINKDTDKSVSTAVSIPDNSTNPWARATTSPAVPSPPKSPLSASKPTYNTAPSSSADDDWDEIKENESDDDSSDDEIVKSRLTRANIAQQLFGSMLPRPTSAATNSPVVSPTSPGPVATSVSAPAPPPPPSAPAPPPAPSMGVESGPEDVSALMRSIQGGLKLRPTKTVDKSGPPVSGRVLGESAPPTHINGGQQPFSPPSPPSSSRALPEPVLMAPSGEANLDNRQSVGWFANRAIDAGLSNSWVDVLPTTAEGEEQEEKITIPTIQVDQAIAQESENNLLLDIDKTQEYRVRTLYPYVGDGPDDLSFEENLVILANPSKSGGDWWYGTLISTQRSGLFPKTFVEVVQPMAAKALYDYAGSNTDELQFNEGDVISILDRSDVEWWKAERNGVVYIVPATYVEVVEG